MFLVLSHQKGFYFCSSKETAPYRQAWQMRLNMESDVLKLNATIIPKL